MSINVVFNGNNYIIPSTNEVGWGANLDSYFIAIAAGCLQKTGGSFTLSADTNFGASFGLQSIYYKSGSSNIAHTGVVRLAQSDTISFRNFANTTDVPLGMNSSNQLTFNGVVINPFLEAFTPNTTLIADGSGNPISSITTSTELSYVHGVTSAIQSQLNLLAPIANPVFTGLVTTPAIKITTSPTPGYVLTSDSSGNGTWDAPLGTSFPLLAPQGSFAAPSYSFSNDPMTGFFGGGMGSGEILMSSGGVNTIDFSSNGIALARGGITLPYSGLGGAAIQFTGGINSFGFEALDAPGIITITGTSSFNIPAGSGSTSRLSFGSTGTNDFSLYFQSSNLILNYGASQLTALSIDEATGESNFNNHQIHSVADPTGPQDAATKNYVDTTTNTGRILQIISSTGTTSSTTTSTTFVTTNQTVSITPQSSTSKIKIELAFPVAVGAGNTASFALFRGAINLTDATNGFWKAPANLTAFGSYVFVDSPGTTSALTYALYFKTGVDGVTTSANNETWSIIATEISQ